MSKRIYVHHTPLSALLMRPVAALTQDDKKVIDAYRLAHLTRFCQDNGLAAPIETRSAHGKPYAKNISTLAYNQSHSHVDYVLAYSLDVVTVGVDIEYMGRQVAADALARRYFHPDEYALWQARGKDRALWFKLWTIKEAVLKAHGIGIRIHLKSLKANFVTDDAGVAVQDDIGSFYFRCQSQADAMITLAYPVADIMVEWMG